MFEDLTPQEITDLFAKIILKLKAEGEWNNGCN